VKYFCCNSFTNRYYYSGLLRHYNLNPKYPAFFAMLRHLLITLLFLFSGSNVLLAQENEPVYVQGRKYLDLNIRSLEKYSKRLDRTQQNLLKKLKRKEERLAHQLKRNDSLGYSRLQAQSLSFDSILKISRHPDSATFAAKALKGGQKSIDSLKGIFKFIQGKATRVTGASALSHEGGQADYTQQLDGLQGRLAYDQYINELTQQHTKNLEGLAGGKHGIRGIQKELFYAKAKISEWKKLADEPDKAEELALEYLQGTKGFDAAMKGAMSSGSGRGMAGASSADDLEKMGFQTKRMMNAALQQKFGNNLSAVQGNMGKDVQQWQDKATGLQKDIRETGQSLRNLKNSTKPDFKVNPMRGIPFWMRIEKQYSFNTSRATTLTDGVKRPALLTLSASAAYRHTAKLSTGLGLAGDIGLGENWSSIRFSFECIGVRTFINWELIYGVGLYGGYERTYKQYVFKADQDALVFDNSSVHNTRNYHEAVLLGLTKKYKINSKWNGAVQLLYDVWWSEKGLRSPLILRFVNTY